MVAWSCTPQRASWLTRLCAPFTAGMKSGGSAGRAPCVQRSWGSRRPLNGGQQLAGPVPAHAMVSSRVVRLRIRAAARRATAQGALGTQVRRPARRRTLFGHVVRVGHGAAFHLSWRRRTWRRRPSRCSSRVDMRRRRSRAASPRRALRPVQRWAARYASESSAGSGFALDGAVRGRLKHCVSGRDGRARFRHGCSPNVSQEIGRGLAAGYAPPTR